MLRRGDVGGSIVTDPVEIGISKCLGIELVLCLDEEALVVSVPKDAVSNSRLVDSSTHLSNLFRLLLLSLDLMSLPDFCVRRMALWTMD